MVSAGELGGVLELVLTRLAEFQEKAQKIKNKVVAAMVYPVIVLVLAIAIMVFLLVFIVPKFEAIFQDMLGDKPLPAITLFVIGVSNAVKEQLDRSSSARSCSRSSACKLAGRTRRRTRRDRSDQAAHAALRRSAAQERDLPLHAHARHARHQRRADPCRR